MSQTLTPLEQYRASMSEAQLQSAIIEAVERLGGRWAHIRDSRGQPAVGLPDLIIAMPNRAMVMFVECKGQRGQVRPKQAEWMEDLRQCDEVVAAIVRPLATEDAAGLDDVLGWLEGTS